MKKLLIALLIVALIATLIACSKTDENGAESSTPVASLSDSDTSSDSDPIGGGDSSSDIGNDSSSDDGSGDSSSVEIPEDIDQIGDFRDVIVPNATEDVVDDSYEWIS